MYEALSVPEICSLTRSAMMQSAAVLLKKYPEEFTMNDLAEHADDLLCRFQNRALGDTIFRVGCDLQRKLSPEDRLAGAIHEAIRLGLNYDKILFALVCGCHFRAGDEEGKMLKGDIEFAGIYQKGIRTVLHDICGFIETENSSLFTEAENIDGILKKNGIRYFLK
jgi:mannitol-1-phosphate 5-dehydrogenase